MYDEVNSARSAAADAAAAAADARAATAADARAAAAADAAAAAAAAEAEADAADEAECLVRRDAAMAAAFSASDAACRANNIVITNDGVVPERRASAPAAIDPDIHRPDSSDSEVEDAEDEHGEDESENDVEDEPEHETIIDVIDLTGADGAVNHTRHVDISDPMAFQASLECNICMVRSV